MAEQCHYVGHLNAIKAQLTVAENARFWAAYLGGPETGVAAALGRLQLSALAGIKAGYLSAGQKRRLGLVRMLVVARPLWLLDEPLVSLDTASQVVLAQLIDTHVAAGGMAIAATHQPLGLRSARELRLGGGRPGG